MIRFAALVLFTIAGSAFAQIESECVDSTPHFADSLVQATGASGKGYGNPLNALNGVQGAGANAGGLDVFSLNLANDGILIAAFSQGIVCNGPGIDVNVFENGFRQISSNALFFEPVVVSVSYDGIYYEDFPHSYIGTASLADVVDETKWLGFAGMTPVLYNETTNNFAEHGIDPVDPSIAGGDGFDMEDLPATVTGLEIKAKGFRYIKLTGAPKLGFPSSPNSFGGLADIDGIYAKRFHAVVN